jgi:hypothetical protein
MVSSSVWMSSSSLTVSASLSERLMYNASTVDLYFMVAWRAMEGYGIATPVDVGVVWKKMRFLWPSV